jgi:hypothetical protein
MEMVHGSVPLVAVIGVAVIGDHKLRVLFDDGTVGDVSYAGRDWGGVLSPLGDPAVFATVTADHGTLYWPKYDLDLAPEPLYEAAKANALAPVSTAA